MKIKLQDIVIDKDTQSRDIVDESVVHEYAEKMEGGEKFPPIVVFNTDSGYLLVDGFHRYFAYLSLGVEEIETIVHKGSERDAEKFSWGVNDKHGLPRSNATKRLIVLKIMDDPEHADENDREIARLANVSHTFVQNIRKEINRPKAEKPVEKPADKPVKLNTVVEAPLEEDHMLKELADLNAELHQENQKYRDKEMVLSGDQKVMEETIADLRKQITVLEMELSAVKTSRDQAMAENAELKRSIASYKRKLDRLEK
jgi:uncharacterized small protein (DUF1192 family)